jgi:hypothetical protein
MIKINILLSKTLKISVILAIFLSSVTIACQDAVVLVHGNTATPSSWDNTYNKLLNNGYKSSEIYLPNWVQKLARHAIIIVAVKKLLCVKLFRMP